jgi:hypothetical protein
VPNQAGMGRGGMGGGLKAREFGGLICHQVPSEGAGPPAGVLPPLLLGCSSVLPCAQTATCHRCDEQLSSETGNCSKSKPGH